MRAYSLRNVATPLGPLTGGALLAWSLRDGSDVPSPIAAQVDPGHPGSVLLWWDDATTFQTGRIQLATLINGQWFAWVVDVRADLPPIGTTEAHGVPPHPGIDPYPLPLLEPSATPFPSRADVLSLKTYFQGLWVRSNAFSAAYQAAYGGDGTIPLFGAALQDFAAAGDLDQVLDQLLAASPPATHAMIDLASSPPGYNEAGQPYGSDRIIPPMDLIANPDAALPIIDRIIARGLNPVYVLDGEGSPAWVRANLQPWVDRLGPDRVRRGLFLVAFDGVWPATWTVDDMQTMIPWMRSVIGPAGQLGFFFANDYLWVVGELDYAQPWMDGLDLVFTSNGEPSAECPSLANKAGYMLRAPNFGAAGCFPDQGYTFVLFDCSRGPRVWLEGEYATFPTVRTPGPGGAVKAFCDAARARCLALGCVAWG